MDTMSVVSPVGLPLVKVGNPTTRLADLEGKTIGEVWNGDFKGDITFPLIRELLRQRFPSLAIIPFTEFPHFHVSDDPRKQRERVREIARLANSSSSATIGVTGYPSLHRRWNAFVSSCASPICQRIRISRCFHRRTCGRRLGTSRPMPSWPDVGLSTCR